MAYADARRSAADVSPASAGRKTESDLIRGPDCEAPLARQARASDSTALRSSSSSSASNHRGVACSCRQYQSLTTAACEFPRTWSTACSALAAPRLSVARIGASSSRHRRYLTRRNPIRAGISSVDFATKQIAPCIEIRAAVASGSQASGRACVCGNPRVSASRYVEAGPMPLAFRRKNPLLSDQSTSPRLVQAMSSPKLVSATTSCFRFGLTLRRRAARQAPSLRPPRRKRA